MAAVHLRDSDGIADNAAAHVRITVGRAPSRAILTGADAGGGPHVRRFTALDGGVPPAGALTSFFAFGPSFTGGVRVAEGDINGDGVPDQMVRAGPGGGPEVRVFDGATGVLLRSITAFEPEFRGGVFVAAGDVNGNGLADIVVGSDAGRSGEVKVFDGRDLRILEDIFAFPRAFTGGVRVAAGDVTGDGYDDIVTGAGAGGGPHVRVFDGLTIAPNAHGLESGLSFFAFDSSFAGGVRVATGDVTGDGRADIIVGAGPGGAPEVRVFEAATATRLSTMLAYAPGFTGGVFVATATPVNRMAIDLPSAGESLHGTFRVAGWAIEEERQVSRIDAWASPVDGSSFPVSLGSAQLGGLRPDVAQIYGAQYGRSGFNLTAAALQPGTWDIYVTASARPYGLADMLRVVRVVVTP